MSLQGVHSHTKPGASQGMGNSGRGGRFAGRGRGPQTLLSRAAKQSADSANFSFDVSGRNTLLPIPSALQTRLRRDESGAEDSSANCTETFEEEGAEVSDVELRSEPASTAAAAANAARAAAAARLKEEELKRRSLEEEAVGELKAANRTTF